MDDLNARAKKLVDDALTASENLRLVVSRLGLTLLPDQCKDDKIGYAVEIDGQRLLGRGNSTEEAHERLLKKITGEAN